MIIIFFIYLVFKSTKSDSYIERPIILALQKTFIST